MSGTIILIALVSSLSVLSSDDPGFFAGPLAFFVLASIAFGVAATLGLI